METVDVIVQPAIEPQVIDSNLTLTWNNAELAKYLEEKLEKYNGKVKGSLSNHSPLVCNKIVITVTSSFDVDGTCKNDKPLSDSTGLTVCNKLSSVTYFAFKKAFSFVRSGSDTSD